MILLNPGPVNVSERVRNALTMQDICHRESECADLMANIQDKLLRAFVPGAESDYVAILLTGSGTAAVEATILSALPMGKRFIVINNGVYGQRISLMVASQRLGASEIKVEWHTRPDPEKVRLILQQHKEAYAVAMVHHETTLGLINPVEEIAKIVDGFNRVFIVDSVSGLAGESIDIAKSHMYLVAGTAGKCIQGFPGVSFVLARKGYMDKMLKFPKRSCYLNLANYYQAQQQGSVPFTPAVQVYSAFHEALTELLEEGVNNRIQRYARGAKVIREGMASLGVQAVLPAEVQSNSLTAFYLPDGVSYQNLHDQLKAREFVIYAGQDHLESKIFRVANMGNLEEKDFQAFLSAFEEVLQGAPAQT